jgi:glycosyltransferase involved in cell wall biosynthesis
MEMHVGFLSTHLAGRGHKIIPVCYPDSPLEHDLRERGFKPLHLKRGGYFHPFAIRQLANWMKKMKVELVHSHYSRDLWAIVPALQYGYRLPLIFTKHIGTQKPKRDWLHRWIYRHVDHCVAISEVIRRNLIATHPLAAEQISVVHHGVDLDQFTPDRIDREAVRNELGYAREHLVLGIIGRLQISKGYLEFLEMARRIKSEAPQARFLLIGEASRGESSEAQMILEKIREWQLEEIVQWLGFRRDIPRLLSAMDIFVFPSHAEAFGIVLIEAMAMAKPVVSSNCDGVLDIVQDHEAGLMVPPRNVEALTQAVSALARDARLRLELGRRARSHVLKFFTLQHTLDAIEFIYHRALSQRGIT